jgi:putative transposase
MARLRRLALGGLPHLVVQRALPGVVAFADDAERGDYLDMLGQALRAQGVALWGYALLENEAWLLLQPATGQALGQAIQALGRRYVAAVNRRRGRRGTLWDGRFRAAVIEPQAVLLDALVHVETLPVAAGLALSAAAWRWSSARQRLGLARDARLADPPAWWALGNTPFEREAAWRRRLDAGLTPAQRRAIEDAALHGWALGPPGFVAEVGQRAGRPAARRPRGRPRAGPRAPLAS